MKDGVSDVYDIFREIMNQYPECTKDFNNVRNKRSNLQHKATEKGKTIIEVLEESIKKKTEIAQRKRQGEKRKRLSSSLDNDDIIVKKRKVGEDKVGEVEEPESAEIVPDEYPLDIDELKEIILSQAGHIEYLEELIPDRPELKDLRPFDDKVKMIRTEKEMEEARVRRVVKLPNVRKKSERIEKMSIEAEDGDEEIGDNMDEVTNVEDRVKVKQVKKTIDDGAQDSSDEEKDPQESSDSDTV